MAEGTCLGDRSSKFNIWSISENRQATNLYTNKSIIKEKLYFEGK